MRLLTDAEYSEEWDITVDELINEYTSDVVPDTERKVFEERFLHSPQGRQKLHFALALKQRVAELKHPKSSRSFFKFYLPIAASILLTLAVGATVWKAFFQVSDVERGLTALRKASGGQRTVEGRLSNFDYAPALQLRGAEKGDSLMKDLAASLLMKAVTEHPTAASHLALGQYYLVDHQFDKAVEHLTSSLSREPLNAKAHNDLGVALMERAKTRGPGSGAAMRDFGESLEHLNQALELDAALLEALFNRALLKNVMGLQNEAAKDWRAYLVKDPNSQWSDEAREHLREIEQHQNKDSSNATRSLSDLLSAFEDRDDDKAWSIISRSYGSGGNIIAYALVDAYLHSRVSGKNAEADRNLKALDYVADLEFTRAGDAFTRDLAQFYRGASAAECRVLAQARELLNTSYAQYLKSNLQDALYGLLRAKSSFDRMRAVNESMLAHYLVGLCYFLQLDLMKSTEVIQSVLTSSERRGYAWLRAHSLYRLAMLRLSANKYSESIDYGRSALAKMERAGDLNGCLKVLILLADQYQALNDENQSLGFLQRGLALAAEASPDQVWGMYTALGLNFGSLGLNRTAFEYHQEALRVANEINRPLQISRSHSYLGVSYGNLGDYDNALTHIQKALDTGNLLVGEVSGQEMIADTSLYAGEIYRQSGDQDKAIEAYDRAISFYARLNLPYFNYMAHKGKLLALLARDNDQSADGELQTVLRIFEQYRVDLTRGAQRNSFFEVEQRVYDRAIDFAYSRKRDAALAFDYSELSRARSLLDAMQKGKQVVRNEGVPELRLDVGAVPLLMAEVQQNMPEQAQILQYVVLDHKILAWLITRRGVVTEEIKVDAVTLEEKVNRYLRAIDRPTADWQRTNESGAEELYDLLIKGFVSHLDKTKLLCIVPDKILNYLPFAALLSSATGKYLVEDYRLESAPSSTIFVECSERAEKMPPVSGETLLSVGNPTFDSVAFASLTPLPSAETEARQIAAFYKSSRLLLGKDATEKALVGDGKKFDVMSFAVHYVVAKESDMLSGMVLAEAKTKGNSDNDGLWQLHEIYGAEFPRTRLVVLSACQTGIERQYRGEGAVGAARPFIAAGVPLVIATLWPVDSDSSSSLIVRFHKHRTLGQSSSTEALQTAQLELLTGKDERYHHPYYWAAFFAVGGYTHF